eukprot:UN20313
MAMAEGLLLISAVFTDRFELQNFPFDCQHAKMRFYVRNNLSCLEKKAERFGYNVHFYHPKLFKYPIIRQT